MTPTVWQFGTHFGVPHPSLKVTRWVLPERCSCAGHSEAVTRRASIGDPNRPRQPLGVIGGGP